MPCSPSGIMFAIAVGASVDALAVVMIPTGTASNSFHQSEPSSFFLKTGEEGDSARGVLVLNGRVRSPSRLVSDVSSVLV